MKVSKSRRKAELRAFREDLAQLRNDGFALCKIPKGEKGPRYRGWHLESLEPDDFQLGDNVGIICGPLSGGLICADLDFPIAEYEKYSRMADLIFPETGMMDGRPGKERSHRYYRVEERSWADSDLPGKGSVTRERMDNGEMPYFFGRRNLRSETDDLGLDILGATGMVVCPPSLHKSGNRRFWEGGLRGEPATITFDQLMIDSDELTECFGIRKRSSWCDLSAQEVPNGYTLEELDFMAEIYVARTPGGVEGGGRENHTLKVAGYLAIGLGLGFDGALPHFLEHNEKNIPPYDEDYARRKLQQAIETNHFPWGWACN